MSPIPLLQQQRETATEQDTVPPSLPSQAALTYFLLLQAEEAAAGSTAVKALEQLQDSHSSIVGCLDAAAAQGRQGACSGALIYATTVVAPAVGSGLACMPFTLPKACTQTSHCWLGS